MHVSAQVPAFAAHHQADFGVRLEFDEAVHHLDAGTLEIARPFDIGRLVETRLELDKGGHRLAGVRRLDQRSDDWRILRRAVERLFDGDHVGIGRRLAKELHHDIEALERVVHNDILGPDRCEAIAAMVPDAFGKARNERLEKKIAALIEDQLLGIAQSQQMLDDDQVGQCEIEMVGDVAPQILRHGFAALHMDDGAAAAALEQRFEQPYQILGFFFDFHVAVADDAEES